MITAVISYFLIDVFGDVIFIYTIFGIIFAIGSFLSAINCNLREIYSAILFIGCIIWAISPYFNNHKIIFSIIDIYLIIAIFCSVKESIENIRNDVDPDIYSQAIKFTISFKITTLVS